MTNSQICLHSVVTKTVFVGLAFCFGFFAVVTHWILFIGTVFFVWLTVLQERFFDEWSTLRAEKDVADMFERAKRRR